jgi:tetratricopeptide (TPR) repeat protein
MQLMDDQFKERLETARRQVDDARRAADKTALAHALKALGNIERRPPSLRDSALNTYAEAAQLYHELALPLDEAWVLRHIGIIHEYAERLHDAEVFYDQALSLFRSNADRNTLDYANTVRYPAVIKNRLGKREESRFLWEEAAKRYQDILAPAGVAEAAGWLAIFAIEANDLELAGSWLEKAKEVAERAGDKDTFKFIQDVEKRFEEAGA